jgi:hypothetical protein
MTPEQLFEKWQNEEGIRFLNEDNSVPDIKDRVRHAFMAGLHHNYIQECMKAAILKMSIETKQSDENATE